MTQDKDVFEAFYNKCLTKLLGKSATINADARCCLLTPFF